ncbi:hypothetical protein MTO96_043881, partial [Rhipicephalus appendiculatus]
MALLAVLEKRNPHVHIVELRRRLLRCRGIEPFGIGDAPLAAHIQQDIVKGGMFNAHQSCDRSILAKWAVWPGKRSQGPRLLPGWSLHAFSHSGPQTSVEGAPLKGDLPSLLIMNPIIYYILLIFSVVLLLWWHH